MIGEIRELLGVQPFFPFTIVTSGDSRYRVASPDHADIGPHATSMIVWFDDDSSVTLAGRHITAVEKDAPEPGVWPPQRPS